MKSFIIIILLILGIQQVQGQEKAPEDVVEEVGDILQIALPAIAFSVELLRNDKEGMVQYAKVFAINWVSFRTLKLIINKPRPHGRGAQAFPSGHTAASFQAAGFIHKRHGFKFAIPAYIGAAFVAYSRVEGAGERHDWWDVGAGALLGTTISLLLTTKPNNGRVKVNSYPIGSSLGFSLQYKF